MDHGVAMQNKKESKKVWKDRERERKKKGLESEPDIRIKKTE